MKRFYYLALIVVLPMLAGIAGYAIRAKAAEEAKFEHLLQNLTTDLLLHDAIVIDRGREAMPVLKARLETSFFYFVEMLDEETLRSRTPDLRCGISKRVRMLRASGELFGDAESLRDSGIALNVIDGYLNQHCPGPPKRDNLMPPERADKD